MNKNFFEWDESKNQINILKHHISFEEAVAVFNDPHYVIIQDDHHSKIEKRYFAIGKVREGILTLRFTYRDDDVVRVFGAGFWRKGKKIYEIENKV